MQTPILVRRNEESKNRVVKTLLGILALLLLLGLPTLILTLLYHAQKGAYSGAGSGGLGGILSARGGSASGRSGGILASVASFLSPNTGAPAGGVFPGRPIGAEGTDAASNRLADGEASTPNSANAGERDYFPYYGTEDGKLDRASGSQARAGASVKGTRGKGSRMDPKDKEEPVTAYDRAVGGQQGKGGAIDAVHMKNPGQITGVSHLILWKANKDGAHAINMSRNQFLLDGVKDHVGKQFDGNFPIRDAVPLERYDDSFHDKALKPAETPQNSNTP